MAGECGGGYTVTTFVSGWLRASATMMATEEQSITVENRLSMTVPVTIRVENPRHARLPS